MRTLTLLVSAAMLGITAVPAAGAATGGPSPAFPTHAVAASTPLGNLLVNGSFEDVDADGLPAGWSPLWASSAAAFSSEDADASDGARSLRVLDASDAAGVGLRPEAVPVTAGETYVLSLDLNLTSGTLLPTVYFLDAAGNRVGQPSERFEGDPGAWVTRTMEVTAPDGSVAAEPLIYSSVTGKVDGLVDNATFVHVAPGKAEGTEENLGEPIGGVTNAGAGYTENAEGRDIGLVVAGGSPSRFSAVDLVTGERLMSQTIEASTLTWAYATTPDRKVYVATSSGEVYVFDPDALTLALVADKPFGERYFWEAQSNAAGEVYFATYPGGKVISYDTVADEWHDHGQMVEGNAYVRSLAVADDGYVYAGGGTADAAIVRLDPATGEKVRIDLPEGYGEEQFVYDLSVAGNLLFARPTPSSDLLVYSLTEGTWVDTISKAGGLEVSPAVRTSGSGVERTEVVITVQGDGAIAYDLETRERRPISLDLGGASARGWSLQDVGLDGFPGESLVTATSKAVFHVWNPQTGETRSVRADADPTPFLIRSMATGPDGNVYVGGYASPPGIARADAESGETELLPLSGQPEGMVAHENYLVVGTYPGGWLNTYDTTRGWEPGTNPAPRVAIGHGQDRPVAFASADDVVAVGSVPDYGQLGGALTLFDPATQEMSVLEEVVEDQTVISLAYRDGLIYGGTGIWGGLGVDPTTAEGKLFVLDPTTGEVVFETVPVPGEENISALTFDPHGNLWGLTANELFRFDPGTREVVERRRYFDTDDSAAYWTTRELFWHHGTLVGQTAGRLFEIDPDTLEMTVLQTGVQNLAIDRLGSYYYNRGGVLYRWVPADALPTCDRTLVGAHDGPLDLTEGVTCLEGAQVEGPVTVSSGASVVVSGSSVVGPFRADGADEVILRDGEVTGPVSIHRSTDRVVVSGNRITGPLACDGNATTPTDEGVPNRIDGPASGQCADL